MWPGGLVQWLPTDQEFSGSFHDSIVGFFSSGELSHYMHGLDISVSVSFVHVLNFAAYVEGYKSREALQLCL